MHPTPEEQLDAILRLVEGAASDSAIAEDSNAMLTDASRLIRRLQRSWSGRLPFLSHDNALAAELLTHLAPMLPSLQHEIDDVVRLLAGADKASLNLWHMLSRNFSQ